MNEIVVNPFASQREPESSGSRQVQARENTEVMALAAMAKKFPRDVVRAGDRILNAFTRPTLAEKAQYQFARGGTDIVGPSIRAAEAISQHWGNMSNGWSELNRYTGPDGVGVSEVEAYSVDYESVTRESIKFVVRHWRDTKKGGYALKDERDIYELCANQAQRRKRACILAQIPGDITEMAMQQAAVTLKASADVTPEGVKRLEEAFAALGIGKEAIEKRIQRRLDSIQPAQVVSLRRIYASLTDEMSQAHDWFDIEEPEAAAAGLEAVRAAAAAKKADKGANKAKGAKAADPETGEIPTTASGQPVDSIKLRDVKTSPDAAWQKAEQSAAGALFPARSYAQYSAAILNATSSETAALEMDAARDDLPDNQIEELGAVYRGKWGGK